MGQLSRAETDLLVENYGWYRQVLAGASKDNPSQERKPS